MKSEMLTRKCIYCKYAKIPIDTWGNYRRDDLFCEYSNTPHHADEDTCEYFAEVRDGIQMHWEIKTTDTQNHTEPEETQI